MTPPDLQSLMHRLLDGGTPDSDELAAFERELLGNAEARDQWRQFARLHNALEIRCTSQAALDAAKVVPIDRILARQRRRIAKIATLAAAAVLLVSAIAMWLVMAPDRPAVTAKLRTAPESAYTLVHPEGTDATRGHGLVAGSTLDLTHGVAELRLPHDVRALIEGPAHITLIDDRTLRLDHGRAFFEISTPAGRGFAVATPHQRIVDLGTAFGIEAVRGQRAVGLHVVEGKVRVDRTDGSRGEILTAPRSILLDGTHITRETDPADAFFLRHLPETIETLLLEDFETGLAPGTRHAVIIDDSLIRGADGTIFVGIGDPASWAFQSGISHALEVRNPGFEDAGRSVDNGAPIPHWPHVMSGDWGWGTDRERSDLTPTEGEFFGRLFAGKTIHQDSGEIITAGTTYVLTADVGVAESGRADIRLDGSDRGPAAPLATTSITGPDDVWLRDQVLVFTATEAHATGQSLGMTLHGAAGTVAFDRVRLQAFPVAGAVANPTPPPSRATPPAPDGDRLRPVAFQPPQGGARVSPIEPLTLTFDRPILLGTGRVTLRNLDAHTESVITSGSPRLEVAGHTLTIHPPLDLADGVSHIGAPPGWRCAAAVIRFNPAGDGTRYRRPGLADASRDLGTIDVMRGPHMAAILAGAPGAGIRRTIGPITPGLHYTANVAIGHRAPGATAADPFPGCTIRLISGGTVLAEHTLHTPPGPANGVDNVALPWNSSNLPDGVAPGDPLVLEIAPATTAKAGQLDIDHVRVTAVPHRH